MIRKNYRSHILCMLIIGVVFSSFSQTPVERHGWLKTQGSYLLNEKGNIVQLKGMSFFWSGPSNWYNGGSSIDHFYSEQMVDRLVDDWKCTVLRVAYGTNTDDRNQYGWDYCEKVINAAIKKGVYVIIDWHSHIAHESDQVDKAVTFFTTQAQKYKNTPNVIFEVYNEPITAGDADSKDGSTTNAVKTWKAIKPYLTTVTKAIRGTGSKNLVILGTPYYCQHVGIAAGDPVTDNGKPFENIAYSFHFYAASHGPNAIYVKSGDGGGMENEYLKTGVTRVPVFVSEWGTSHSNGGLDGKNNLDEANTDWWFKNYIDKNYLSWCNWSVSDWQASSAFQGGTETSTSGKIVRKYLNNTNDEFILDTSTPGPAEDTVFTMPDSHPAVSINKYCGSGVSYGNSKYADRDTSDVRGSSRKWVIIDESSDVNWIEYNFKFEALCGSFSLRYLAKNGSGNVEIHVDGEKNSEISVEKTDTWRTIIAKVSIPSGDHKIRLYFTNTTGSYNLNWAALKSESDAVLPHQGILPNSSRPVISSKANSIHLVFPKSHSYTSYSLIRANGSVFKTESLAKNNSEMSINNLSKGVWLLKLDGVKRTDYSKVIITGK